ncbi:hypothetical protein ACFVWY_03520 [Streptomyces sp. NPDC058195]|uniref:hypothetical protein n=1 Tax=Streptomyces sp. NPDC058195 TaxID=3346375 RepID=UPI0036EBF2C9
MSDPNPYADESYKWGPEPQQPGQSVPHQPGVPQGALPGAGVPGALPGAGMPGAFPGAGVPGAAGMPTLVLGDIAVMNDQIVTPSGSMPLKGSVWTATDLTRTEEKIPTVAIVLAIVFALFCLVGLLFLLMKEKQTTGFVQVTVVSDGRHHSTMIPALGPETFPMVMAQVNTARTMSI